MALGGIWILGGVGSLGDIALDSRAITGQVSNVSEDFFFPFIHLSTHVKLTILLYFQAQRHQCKAYHLHRRNSQKC